MFAIRQTYIHHVTGENWIRVTKRRWKTERGARKAAGSIAYSWVHMPDGKTRVAESSAEVIEA
ncbi:hypothetical protein ACQE3D_18250 [Methylomonas sp. MS20]|uniref:hypothetical protein n=1 Tax=Methylomonas sp. MS20 TaxID=3418769 RepID=UPI003CFEECFA